MWSCEVMMLSAFPSQHPLYAHTDMSLVLVLTPPPAGVNDSELSHLSESQLISNSPLRHEQSFDAAKASTDASRAAIDTK